MIKKQAISAYDPRVIEVTGVSMMLTAQGADHTAGNLPHYDSAGKPMKDLAERSYQVQINSAVADSLGLCVFGRTVTDVNRKLIADAINDSYNIDIPPDFIDEIGIETLKLEKEFNRQAGFTVEDDDELPEFFLHEPLAPTNKTGPAARRRSQRRDGRGGGGLVGPAPQPCPSPSSEGEVAERKRGRWGCPRAGKAVPVPRHPHLASPSEEGEVNGHGFWLNPLTANRRSAPGRPFSPCRPG